jgi:hypothetical protein
MYEKTIFHTKLTPILVIALISSILLISSIIVGSTDARKMTPYQCGRIPDSVTIGKVVCCAHEIGTTNGWCTKCDNTHPPSNCGPAYPVREDKGGDTTNPKDSGGVLSNNDDSSGSKGIDPGDIEEAGTFNEDSGSDNTKGIDPNNSGGVFTQ